MATKEQATDLRTGSAWTMRGSGDIPLRKLNKALLAISLGTIIEWYDFTIYTQLSKTLGKVFFPSSDPAMQALSFWGVFFVGYISRPVGAVLFGHLGDTKGRSTCLLISVLVMGIPTVLIGCLPAYHHIGIAAPILLAILRLVQGLAMGGEFGAAMVYLHEIADPRFRAVTGSLGYISLGIGVVFGILVVIMMLSLVPAGELLIWGWRLPFLFAVVTLVAAALLRYNMPESTEFATSREEIDQDYHKRIKQQAMQAANSSNRFLPRTFSRSQSHSDADTVTSPKSPVKDVGSVLAADVVPEDCAAVVESSDLESQGSLQHHYVPVFELFRSFWSGIVLQMGYEAWIAANFYLGYSWLPSFFVTYAGLPTMLTLWMVLTAMVLYTFVVPIAGVLSDRGTFRPVTATIAICVVAAGVSVPMFLAFQTKNLAGCWLLQIVIMCMTGYTMGILPVICSNIYPAGVRISGFNLGYNLGMTVFGGLTPLILTAIQTNTGSIFIGPGLWMTGMAVISIGCSLLLIKRFPLTNATV